MEAADRRKKQGLGAGHLLKALSCVENCRVSGLRCVKRANNRVSGFAKKLRSVVALPKPMRRCRVVGDQKAVQRVAQVHPFNPCSGQTENGCIAVPARRVIACLNLYLRGACRDPNAGQRSREGLLVDMRVGEHAHPQFVAAHVEHAPAVGIVIPTCVGMFDRDIKAPCVLACLLCRDVGNFGIFGKGRKDCDNHDERGGSEHGVSFTMDDTPRILVIQEDLARPGGKFASPDDRERGQCGDHKRDSAC